MCRKLLLGLLVVFALLTVASQGFAQDVFPTVELTSFDPVTYTYTYTVTCPANSTYQFGYLQIDTQVANEGLTGSWTIDGPYVGAVNKLWPKLYFRWDSTGKDSAVWDPYSRGTVILAKTYWQGVFKLVVPNSQPVDGKAATRDGQAGSYKVHDVQVPGPKQVTPPASDPPYTTIDISGTKGLNDWYISSVLVTISATDPDNDYLYSEYSLNGADWESYINPFEVKVEGENSLQARSGDNAGNVVETGNVILIRHPEWTEINPRQDIPIMVFTIDQWNKVEKEDIALGAAPIGPSKLGCNSKYIFALPARYNFAFPTGFEEVEKIMNNNPLTPNEDFK
jgi:hypothetical protein